MSGQSGPTGPQPPGPGGPWQQAPEQQPPGATGAVHGVPPPPRKKRRGPVLGLVLGGVAVLVAVVLVAGFLVFRNDGKVEAVEKFFQALQDADAAAAIGQLATPPPDQSLMTDEVLATSVELGGVSMIDVLSSTDDSEVDNAGWVTVQLSAGGEETEIQYRVIKQRGEWRLTDAVVELSAAGAGTYGTQRIFNGATPKDDETFLVLPGVYRVTTGSPMITWDSGNLTFLGGVGAPDMLNLSLKLTDEGSKAVDEALATMYERCLASKELEPKHCPFRALDVRFKEGTATWTEIKPPTWGASVMGTYVSGQYEGVVKVDYTYVDSDGDSHSKSQTIPYKPALNVDLTKQPAEVMFPG